MEKVERIKLFGLLNAIESVKTIKDVKFAYALVKNKKRIKEEIELLKEATKVSDKLQEYEKKRIMLCKQYCEKDDNKKPIIKNNSYCGLDNNKNFNEEIKKLREEYKEELDNREKQIEDYNKLLEEKVEIDFYKISLKNIPQDISAEQLEPLMILVNEEK